MAEPLILTMLASKRAELSGTILEMQRTIERHRAELVHLDATIRLFDPEAVPATIRPRGKGHPSKLFVTGELSGFIMGKVRDAPGPVSSRELAEGLMVKKGLDVNQTHTRKKVQQLVRNALSAQKRRGVLASVGEGWDTRWIAVA